ncbi:hypothetical protein GCM10009611_05870 [Arthrobacter roseus]
MQESSRNAVCLRAQAHIVSWAGSSEIQIPVPQTRFLAHLDVFIYLERQRLRCAEDLDILGDHLDIAGRQGSILITGWPLLYRSGDLQDELIAEGIEGLLLADDDLRKTGRIP